MRIALYCLLLVVLPACAKDSLVERLTVPPGFAISLYSDKVPNARAMSVGAHGTVFVGSMGEGKVYALSEGSQSGRAERVRVIASGLDHPAGVAFHDGDLYISAVSRILVLRDIEQRLDDPPAPEVITDRLPKDAHHGWKFIAFGPDGRLYVPIGAPCNICDPGEDYAKLISMRADGSDWRDEARGIRNTVGFAWQPGSNALWFTDNGRDLMGDDLPADELNRIDHAGQNFGFPWCHQGDTLDPEFGKGHSCADYTPPVLKLGAHVAALGMRFYTGQQFPSKYRNAILIAEHGSWNRSTKSGYNVSVARFDGEKLLPAEILVSGFLAGQKTLGRPADVQVMADGAVLISDDDAGAIYRLSYAGKD